LEWKEQWEEKGLVVFYTLKKAKECGGIEKLGQVEESGVCSFGLADSTLKKEKEFSSCFFLGQMNVLERLELGF
jgi:hypothetical protein